MGGQGEPVAIAGKSRSLLSLGAKVGHGGQQRSHLPDLREAPPPGSAGYRAEEAPPPHLHHIVCGAGAEPSLSVSLRSGWLADPLEDQEEW